VLRRDVVAVLLELRVPLSDLHGMEQQ